MSKLTSIFWTTDGTGDGIPYPQCFLTRWQRMTWLNDPTTMGIAVGYLNELEVTNTGLELQVDTGACLVYGFPGWLDDIATHNLTLPLLSNTGWRVVVRIRWDKRTMETVLLESVDGVSDIPEITQDVGVYWEISLAYGTVSTMGVVTVNDNRTFLSSAGEITGDMIADESITLIEIQNRTRKFWSAAVDAYNSTGGAEAAWNIGTGWGWVLANGVNTRTVGAFCVPNDFVSDMAITGVFVSDGGGGGDFYLANLHTFYGTNGEIFTTHNDTLWSATLTEPGNGIRSELQYITMTAPAIGDYVMLEFSRAGGDPSDTATADLIFMGWIISYTADS